MSGEEAEQSQDVPTKGAVLEIEDNTLMRPFLDNGFIVRGS